MIIKELKLQALEIPAGWSVEINHFYDLDPLMEEIRIEDERFYEPDGWKSFDQDLLFLLNRRIDPKNAVKLYLGWMPSYSRSGRFILEVVKEHGEESILKFESRSKSEVVIKINEILRQLSK